MSESELLMLHVELLNGVWSVIQAWIGATTALVAAAYFAASRFSASIVTALLCLYSLFTASCATQMTRSWGRILAIAEDLNGLQERGVQLSNSSLVLTQNVESRLVAIVSTPMFLIIFLASIAYVIYCYRSGEG